MARADYAAAHGVGFRPPGPIDLTDLRRLADNDNEPVGAVLFVREVIGLFLDMAPRLRQSAVEAIADGDASSLARVTHRLKTQASFFGARRLARVCRQLEELARTGETRRAAALMDDLEDEVDRVVAALRGYCD